MKNATKALAAAAATISLFFAGNAAQAVTPPEGGTWNYGVTGKYTYSNYLHNSREHKATACGVGCDYSGWVQPTKPANAQTICAPGGNTAFYNVR
jgi:lactococcin 972 family bacteriocin